MENLKTFRIGIAMAGAVSAGAYTAGVMDYLLEALENWQRAKELELHGVPVHDVVIEVLTGASAGGMTAIITAASIQKDFPHINRHNYFTCSSQENPLFRAWVDFAEEEEDDIMGRMLGLEDILESPDSNPMKEVRSIFNSLFIEKIARRILDATISDPHLRRPYFAADLELLTTLTNLRGFNYELEFISASGKHVDRMTSHRDLMHYQLNPGGIYGNNGKIPFHFSTPEGLNKQLMVDGAIATGAYPAGLASRLVTRDPKYINDNPLLRMSHGRELLVDPKVPYRAVCVDGGVINNEPYDLTERCMAQRRKEEMKQEGTGGTDSKDYKMERIAGAFDSTILMIDPFPCLEELPVDIYPGSLGLKETAAGLLGAARQQLMVKAELLGRAYDENDYSRFMIAPSRTKNGVSQEYSIACGSLGGFGGFFSRKFRIHDYMLGRRNCQRFLQNYFCVPESANNPIIRKGYSHLKADELNLIRHRNQASLPIIPDIRIADNNKSLLRPRMEEEFPYPCIKVKYLLELEKKVQERFHCILRNMGNGPEGIETTKAVNRDILKYREQTWFRRNIVQPATDYAAKKMIPFGKKIGKDVAARKFIDAVISDFDKAGLLKNNSETPPDPADI